MEQRKDFYDIHGVKTGQVRKCLIYFINNLAKIHYHCAPAMPVCLGGRATIHLGNGRLLTPSHVFRLDQIFFHVYSMRVWRNTEWLCLDKLIHWMPGVCYRMFTILSRTNANHSNHCKVNCIIYLHRFTDKQMIKWILCSGGIGDPYIREYDWKYMNYRCHSCVKTIHGKWTVLLLSLSFNNRLGLPHVHRQPIIWTNAFYCKLVSEVTVFNAILIKIQQLSFQKMYLKILFAQWPTFCHGLGVFTIII